MKQTSKKFDCVEFKRKAQERIYEKIRDMSWEEEIDYFSRSAETGPLSDWWKRAKAAHEKRRKKDI